MRIAIIGAGVVGKAVGEAFRHHGHRVMYIDKRPERGASWMIYRTASRFDVAMICVDVPTISNPPIGQSINQIKGVVGEALKNADHVVIKSAVLPGTTDALRELFNTDAIHVNPEFLRERYAKRDALEPLLIVGDDADLMYALYYYLYRQGKRSRFLEATIETNVEMGGVSDAYYHYRRRR